MMEVPRILESIPGILVANTAHAHAATKIAINELVINITYNFNHTGIMSDQDISDLWKSYNRRHDGYMGNWIMAATSRFRAVNGLNVNGWDNYVEAISDMLTIAPDKESSLLDEPTAHNSLSCQELKSMLGNNPWLVFIISIYLCTNMPAKLFP